MKKNVRINNPCDQDWNKMLPEKTGRHCEKCQKSVTDFTEFSLKEIQNFFKQSRHSNKAICGRFRVDQLAPTPIQIPISVAKSGLNSRQIVFLAILITFGITFSSCTDMSENSKQPTYQLVMMDDAAVDTVAVDQERVEEDQLDSIYSSTRNAFQEALFFGVKEELVPIFEIIEEEPPLISGMIMMGDIEPMEEIEDSTLGSRENPTRVFDENPEFPGGHEKLTQYIQENVIVPSDTSFEKEQVSISYVEFVIDSTGEIQKEEMRLLKSCGNEELDQEAKRLLVNSPKWIPGMYNNRKAWGKFILPVRFNISVKRKSN